MSWHLTTCPNVPCPRTSRIRYLEHVQGDPETEQYNNGLVSFFSPQPVIHIEDVVVVLIVVPFVVRRLARLCEHSSWVMSRLVLELGIAYAVGIGDVRCQLTQGL